MFPKVGDVVRLNPDFLKMWFRRGNKYLKEEVWKERLTITEVKETIKDFDFIIRFKSKDKKPYRLYILSNGELSVSTWRKEHYENIQVFIPTN